MSTENQNKNNGSGSSSNLDFMKESAADILELQKKVRKEDLGFGVYKMKIINLSEFVTKNQESMLKIEIDTGFSTKEGGVRKFNILMWYNGHYPDGKPRAEKLIQLYKRISGKDELKRVSDIKTLIGIPFACATQKSVDGFFEFWYADNIKNLDRMQLSYKPKDLHLKTESTPNNFPKEPTPTIAETMDDLPF